MSAPSCGVTPRPHAPAQTDEALTVDGRRRTFVLHVPDAYDGSTPFPLVFLFPPTGSTGADILQQSELAYGNRGRRYIVAALDPPSGARRASPAGVRARRGGGASTALNVGLDATADPSGADDVAFVRAVHGALSTRLCIDARRVYAAGHSRGGRFASRLASEMAEVFAAIAPVGGLRFPRPNNATRPVAVVAFHGTSDPINPYGGGGAPYWQTGIEEAASAWARHNGCRRNASVRLSARVTKLVHDECDEAANVVLYRVDGLGHTWPGSRWYQRRPGSARALGRASLELSASAIMSAFWEGLPPRPLRADDEPARGPQRLAPPLSPPTLSARPGAATTATLVDAQPGRRALAAGGPPRDARALSASDAVAVAALLVGLFALGAAAVRVYDRRRLLRAARRSSSSQSHAAHDSQSQCRSLPPLML